jgi:hypothetical protein
MITERILAADVNVSLVFSYIYVQSGKYYLENTICGRKYFCVQETKTLCYCNVYLDGDA